MEPYGREDVILTRKVSEQYDPVIEANEDLKGVIEFERKVFDAKATPSKRGLPVDRDGYAKLELEVVENLEAMEDRIEALAAEAGVEDFNPRSTPQVIAALKARGADLSYMSQKDGKLSADKEKLRLSTTSWLRRSWSSAPSSGAVHLRAAVHPSSLLDAASRLEGGVRCAGLPYSRHLPADRSAHWPDELRRTRNIQNQPRDDLQARYNVRAEPGMKLVGADLSNIEMRLFAVYAGEGALIDAVRQNKDIHTMTAPRRWALPTANARAATSRRRASAARRSTFRSSTEAECGRSCRQQRCSQDHAKLLKRRYYDATRR